MPHRLSALQKNGEEGWRKRVSRNLDLDPALRSKSPSPSISTEDITVRLREKRSMSPAARPSSIADRLSKLDNAQGGWRDRVGGSASQDAKKFTIEHKMGGMLCPEL